MLSLSMIIIDFYWILRNATRLFLFYQWTVRSLLCDFSFIINNMDESKAWQTATTKANDNTIPISGSICMNVTDMLMIVMTSHIANIFSMMIVVTVNCQSSQHIIFLCIGYLPKWMEVKINAKPIIYIIHIHILKSW